MNRRRSKSFVNDHTGFQDYANSRQSLPILKYGLRRRTEAVIATLTRLLRPEHFRLLDIGTADGVMLATIQSQFPNGQLFGLDMNLRLCRVAQENGLRVVQGYAPSLPFASESCDVVLMAATLKHVKVYEQALRECRRVLKPNGHMLISDPTPLGIRAGIARGHFNPRYVYNVWSVRALSSVLAQAGFSVTYYDRYLLAPVPIPGLFAVEALLKHCRLNYFFLHQIVAAKKAASPTCFPQDQ